MGAVAAIYIAYPADCATTQGTPVMLGSSWKPLRIRKNLYGITYTYMYTSCVVERPYICIRLTYTRRTITVGAVPNPTYLYDLRTLRRLIHLPHTPPFLYTYIYTYTTYVYKPYTIFVGSTELRCSAEATVYIYLYQPLRLSVYVPRYVPELRGLRPLSGPTRGHLLMVFCFYIRISYMYIYTYT